MALMSIKNEQAVFSVGERTFHIPVHEELVRLIEISESSLKVDSYELNRFVLGFLSRRKVTVYLKIGSVMLPFDIPAYAADSLEVEVCSSIPISMLSEDLGQIIRKMIPTDLRPATERQLTFAKQIASTLCIDFPVAARTSFLLCGEFIDKNIDAFNERSHDLKIYGRIARHAARGYVAAWLINATGEGEVTEFVLKGLGISQITTVRKYLQNFYSFPDEYRAFEPYFKDACLRIFNQVLAQDYSHISCPPMDDSKIMSLIDSSNSSFNIDTKAGVFL